MSPTLILIGVISIISIFAFARQDILHDFAFDMYAIREHKQYLRLISSGFVHANFSHLLFNMYTFYMFAEGVEKAYSGLLVFGIFLASVLGGSLFSLMRNWKNTQYLAVGASGGVMGVLYASIFLMEPSNIYFIFLPVPIPDRVFAVGFLLISYFFMRQGKGKIGHSAHIGGAITGTIFAICVIPWVLLQEYLVIIAMFVPFLLIFIVERFLKSR